MKLGAPRVRGNALKPIRPVFVSYSGSCAAKELAGSLLMQFCHYFTVIMTFSQQSQMVQFRLQAHENVDEAFQTSDFRIQLIDSCGSLMRLPQLFLESHRPTGLFPCLPCKEHAPAHRASLQQHRGPHSGRGF